MRILAFLFFFALVLAARPAEATMAIGGYTTMTYGSQHGTQVEYLATDGRTWLWYPGNTVILPGQWKQSGANICFRYGANTYNPATGQHGPGWECMPLSAYTSGIVERVKGDPLRLQDRGAAPFSLGRGRTSFASLIARVSPGKELPRIDKPTGPVIANPKGLCTEILANAESSRTNMQMAALIAFDGQLDGVQCAKSDYIRALTLAKKSGLPRDRWIKLLKQRAAAGEARAAAALRYIGVALE
jgi:hypothetical protein